ncbi:hypothetical protein I7I48_07521 [Histoplasma ohiense]|nr:hypothetical protein I7I48_07521 [Histoplasma ohiense (nom. inval.)]
MNAIIMLHNNAPSLSECFSIPILCPPNVDVQLTVYIKRPRLPPPKASRPFPRLEISKKSPKWNFLLDPLLEAGSRTDARVPCRFPLLSRWGVLDPRGTTSTLTVGELLIADECGWWEESVCKDVVVAGTCSDVCISTSDC